MKVTVLSPVEHDGDAYAEGEQIDIKDQAQAQSLIAAGAAVEVVAVKKAAKADASEA